MKSYIEISGPDGTGKSTLSKRVAESITNSELKWLRFNLYLARLVNFLGRLLGLSYYEHYSWGRIGYHKYDGPIGILYVIIAYIDAVIFDKIFFGCRRKNDSILVLDRYLIDTCADLIVSTRRLNLVIWLFTGLIKSHMRRCRVVVLMCPYKTVTKRRVDICDDKVYVTKQAAYRALARTFKLETINTDTYSVDDIVKTYFYE